MTKSRRTVTLDEEIDEYLDAEGVNASQLVNRLVRSYQTAGGSEVGMLRLREQQLESEIQELDSRRETKQDELERVREQLSELQDGRDDVIRDAAESLDDHVRVPDNPAVQNWAEKAGLPPEEFLERLDDLDGGDHE